jgi:hypothetical protein
MTNRNVFFIIRNGGRQQCYLLLLTVFFSLWFNGLFAQLNTDNAYAKPLKEVLTNIEKRYDVKIKYADSMVENKTVKYAEWRYRNDVELTLDKYIESTRS